MDLTIKQSFAFQLDYERVGETLRIPLPFLDKGDEIVDIITSPKEFIPITSQRIVESLLFVDGIIEGISRRIIPQHGGHYQIERIIKIRKLQNGKESKEG